MCPVCAATEITAVKKHEGFDLYFCGACGLRFSHPMEHPGQQWYEDSDIYQEVEWNIPSTEKLGGRWEFAEALRIIGPPPATILDIGCGRGDFLKLADSHGHRIKGIDLNKHLIQVAQKHFRLNDVELTSLENFSKNHPQEQFDVITAFELLEHLPSPQYFIKACFNHLKPGGRLILSIPGFHRFPLWFNKEVDAPPHHFTLWSSASLEILFSQNGFKNVKVERKPLLLGDLMYHMVRWIPGFQHPGPFFKLLRGSLKIIMVPFYLFIRSFPTSGGFTLLATGSK
ncbi:MAG: methyltransferase domain-containing protein [Elusimicrobia bacterium]|nr:methyltransferase domain-containing protein [Candidatus Obscuribacterium magneticum]